MSKRKQYTAEMKVKILREHLENQVSISELSERYGIHPNLIHNWKKQMFEGAVETLNPKQQKRSEKSTVKVKILEEKIKKKDSLIAEIIDENIQLKKNLNGEYKHNGESNNPCHTSRPIK